MTETSPERPLIPRDLPPTPWPALEPHGGCSDCLMGTCRCGDTVVAETEPEHGRAPEPMSWAEAYRVRDCGRCGQAGCEQCAARFLRFLAANGTKPLGGG